VKELGLLPVKLYLVPPLVKELGLLPVKLYLVPPLVKELRLLPVKLYLVPPLVKELGPLDLVTLYLLLPHQVFVNPPLPVMVEF